jgi:hypothetical protein
MPRSRPPSKTAGPRRPPTSETSYGEERGERPIADVTGDMDSEHAQSLGRRYLIRFEEDTLRQRPLWIRLIIEFLGTFILVTVAAGDRLQPDHRPAHRHPAQLLQQRLRARHRQLPAGRHPAGASSKPPSAAMPMTAAMTGLALACSQGTGRRRRRMHRHSRREQRTYPQPWNAPPACKRQVSGSTVDPGRVIRIVDLACDGSGGVVCQSWGRRVWWRQSASHG